MFWSVFQEMVAPVSVVEAITPLMIGVELAMSARAPEDATKRLPARSAAAAPAATSNRRGVMFVVVIIFLLENKAITLR